MALPHGAVRRLAARAGSRDLPSSPRKVPSARSCAWKVARSAIFPGCMRLCWNDVSDKIQASCPSLGLLASGIDCHNFRIVRHDCPRDCRGAVCQHPRCHRGLFQLVLRAAGHRTGDLLPVGRLRQIRRHQAGQGRRRSRILTGLVVFAVVRRGHGHRPGVLRGQRTLDPFRLTEARHHRNPRRARRASALTNLPALGRPCLVNLRGHRFGAGIRHPPSRPAGIDPLDA